MRRRFGDTSDRRGADGHRLDRGDRPGDAPGSEGRRPRGAPDRHARAERHQPQKRQGVPRPAAAHDRPADRQGRAVVTSWDHVADWYDKLVGDEGSDYHRHVVLPAAMRLLDPQPGEKVLDLCCGQGVFVRQLAQLPAVQVVGVDASPSLIEAARRRGSGPNLRYVVADACNLGDLADGSFDGVACLMAVHDLDDIEAMFRGVAKALRQGGRAVLVLMHPCFRVPRQSSWGWDDQKKTQYRRLDRYYTPMTIPIATHPGRHPETRTLFFHRPISAYINALAAAGLAVVACEELLSHHKSQPGGHSRGENRSRQEFPVFVALKALKLAIHPA
jgi:ubiquinone/menaquinone biosynthesis C-methylase UbiE